MTEPGGPTTNATGRASGKRRSNKRTAIGGAFAALLVEMLESPAWRVLSLSGRRVLDRVGIELAHHGGADNGRLPVTFEQFIEYGMDRHTIGPAIRECEALGFLEVTEQGRAGNAEFRRPNKFRLTYQPSKSHERTHEWRKIETIEAAQLLARASRRPHPKQREQCQQDAPPSNVTPLRTAR
jgi:hypothetical protein